MNDLVATTFVVGVFLAYAGLMLALIVWIVRQRFRRGRRQKIRQGKAQSKPESIETKLIPR